MCCFVLAVFPQDKHLQPPPRHGLIRVFNISPRTSAMLIQLAVAVFGGGTLLFGSTMGFMVLQWFVIRTELLTIRTQVSSAVHMLCLNMLIKVGSMTGRVLTIQTKPATLDCLLHPRQHLAVTVFPSIIFTEYRMKFRKLFFIQFLWERLKWLLYEERVLQNKPQTEQL